MVIQSQRISLDTVAFPGLVVGIALLFVCLFVEDCPYLAVPGLALTLGALLYAMR
jgi:hypothetical protein